MADYTWPQRGTATILGTSPDRLDGLPKSTGAAKYAYDASPDRMLIARALGCPHAHCKVKKIDVSAARKVPGVVHVALMKEFKDMDGQPTEPEVRWAGDLLAVVAAESEGAAAEGIKAIKVEYDVLDVFVKEEDLAAAEKAKRTDKGGQKSKLEKEPGDDDDEDEFTEQEIERLLKECEENGVVIEGHYGIQAITHMCLEPHGSTCSWQDGKLVVNLSTQNVSGTATQFAEPLEITADDVTIKCDYIGGGFGSKFAADQWGVVAAQISRMTGRPVKLMLERDQELKTAGSRPSGFINVKVGADKNGVIQVWDSHLWGSNGVDGGGIGAGVIPYVFEPKNLRNRVTTISVNASPSRAWRAPNHPQGCAITHTVLDDLAHKLGKDSYDIFLANLPSVSNGKADVYADQMKVAAELMGWKDKWHAHGKGDADGDVVTGLGMALHTWGGGPHSSNCTIKVYPDGGVETFPGSQDIGTGTRTAIGMVVAETLGLPLSAVRVNIGSSKYPASGPSGGSTTIGGVCESNRRAATDALAHLSGLVARNLMVGVGDLEAKEGRIQVRGDAEKGVTWQQACGMLGMQPLEVHGTYQRGKTQTGLTSSQVGGVQMAEVAVDRETGVVKVKKFVAVQDMGLIVNRKTATSQMNGAIIMGIAYSLFEERIMDGKTGEFVNCEIADYRLPRLGDIGEIVVELYEPDSEYQRGVVGLGEPPVISPGAAISNAVCNALGVRVPVLPLTPQRVLAALKNA
ncbi:MAG: xanthine dehydrogenase family protein molybdopterin-binding subunit [Pirellulales bacterium]